METETKDAIGELDAPLPQQVKDVLAVPASTLESSTLERIVWTPERVRVMKRECCPPDISDDEFALWLEKCRRSQMDPIMGEADCVPRNTKVKRTDGTEETITKYVFQMREQGMMARADRHPDFLGIQEDIVYAKDVFSFDVPNNRITHQHAVGERGNLIGAWARVERKGRTPVITFVRYSERVQLKGFGDKREPVETWQKMPETMTRKCARFDALKRAYPNTFKGLEIDADAPADERELNAAPAAAKGAAGAAARVRNRTVKGQAATIDTSVPSIPWANHKLYGRYLNSLKDDELWTLVSYAEKTVASDPKATWVAPMKKYVENCIRPEISKRETAAAEANIAAEQARKSDEAEVEDAETSEPEPGSDG